PVSPDTPIQQVLQQPGSGVKARGSKSFHHFGQIDELRCRCSIENPQKACYPQPPPYGRSSCLQVVEDYEVRPKVFSEEDRLSLPCLKEIQILRRPRTGRMNLQPSWSALYPSP